MKEKSAGNKKKVGSEFSLVKTKKQNRDALIKLISNIIVRMTFEECYGKESELENPEN